jgi:hypothetical protein
MTFAPSVVRVRVEVEPGPPISAPTKYLSMSQAAKVHIARYRYLAVSVGREICVKQVLGFGSDGTQLFAADGEECPL